MIVMKFGGTSVGNAERIKNVADIIKSRINKNPVVVVSAVSKITDALIEMARAKDKIKSSQMIKHIIKTHMQVIKGLGIEKTLLDEDIKELAALADNAKINSSIDLAALDKFQSFGERMSSKIVAAQLNKIGITAKAFNSWELGFLTDSEFGNAEPLEDTYDNLKKNIKKQHVVPVITGFIGKTENGEITTLGRGGSDYTAAIVGAAINAEEIEIWTDVNGILSADPKIVQNTHTMERVSFAEASELAYFGAKVLHPKTLLPAMDKNIPVRVLNSFEPGNSGTTIYKTIEKRRSIIKAIACKKKITMINVGSSRMLGAFGFLARVFDIFDDHRKSVDVVSTSEVSVSLTVDNDDGLEGIMEELGEIGTVQIEKNKAIICAVGEGMKQVKGIAGRIFSVLGNNNINVGMISQGASAINVTFIVDESIADKAVQTLHKEFFG